MPTSSSRRRKKSCCNESKDVYLKDVNLERRTVPTSPFDVKVNVVVNKTRVTTTTYVAPPSVRYLKCQKREFKRHFILHEKPNKVWFFLTIL